MIKKFWKIFLIAFFVLAVVGFGAFGWWQKNQEIATAQNFGVGPTKIICEEPIPIGIAIDNTIDILDQVYQSYKSESGRTARERMAALTTTINKGEGNVCDFDTQCKASVEAAGSDFFAKAKALPLVPGLEKIYSIGTNLPPLCVSMGDPTQIPVGCVGNPCPSLSQFIKRPNDKVPDDTLKGFQTALTTQADNIHALFDGKNKVVIEAIAEKGESPGYTKISDVDFVKRYINYIDQVWLTPNPQGNACVLSKLERARVAQGTMGDKYPKSCLSALADMTYSPKPWSEECLDECASGDLSDECRACLGQCKGDSVFARINCKLYSKGGGQNEKNTGCESWLNSANCIDNDCIWGVNPNDEGTKKDVCVTIKTTDRNNENTTCDKCDNQQDCVEGCKWAKGLGGCEWKSVSVPAESTCYAETQLPLGTDENPKCAIIAGASKKCCGNECEDGLNAACYACLCPKGDMVNGKAITTEQCLDWICGGSKSNWVCCHEEPIEAPLYYVEDDTTEPDAFAPITTGDVVNGEKWVTQMSAYNDRIDKTASGLDVRYGLMASATTVQGFMDLPVGTCVKVTNVDTEGTKEGIKKFAQEHVVNSTAEDNQYFCIADRGGEHIKNGERFDLWLDNTADYYKDAFAEDWGIRPSSLEIWYDPKNLCATGPWKDKKYRPEACQRSPITQDIINVGEVFDKNYTHLRMNYGRFAQWDDASGPLKKLLECADGKLKLSETEGGFGLAESELALISSISDSFEGGIGFCGDADKFNKKDCHHTSADSCHYGGAQSTKVKGISLGLNPFQYKSVAADISLRPNAGVALKAAQAAVCCGSDGGYQVTAMKEVDHYHISIAVKRTLGGNGSEIGYFTDIKDKNYYDCDKGFRTSPKQSQNVISCPK